MRQHQAFDIAYVGLKNGLHAFEYQIDNAFFESFSLPDFQQSRLDIKLAMDKKGNFFLLNFEITGSIQVNCDRCGEPFDMAIWDEFPLVVKRVFDPAADSQEEDPNVVFIPQQETVLNVAKWVYEFALLSIPMQRIHPNDADGKSMCNPAVLKKLEEMKNGKESQSNPIWQGLEQFRNK